MIVTNPGTLVTTVQRGGIEWPLYEQTAEVVAILELRKETLELTLAEAAERVGLTVLEWYEIERGALIPVSFAAVQALLSVGGIGSRYPGGNPGGGPGAGAGAERPIR